MWIMLPFGFFSIVCAHDNGKPDHNLRMIRARKRTHLEALRKRCPELPEIVATDNTDYPYRIIAPKGVVTAIMMNMAEELDYINFKDQAKRVSEDAAYVSFLHTVWGAGLNLTEHKRPRRLGRFFDGGAAPGGYGINPVQV